MQVVTRAYGFAHYFLLIVILVSGAFVNGAGASGVLNPALFMQLASYGHDAQKPAPDQLIAEPDSPGVQTVTGKTYISLYSKGYVDFEISVSGGEWVQSVLDDSLCTLLQAGNSPEESTLYCKGQTKTLLLKLGLTFIADGQLSLTLHNQSRIILVASIPTDDSADVVRTFNNEAYRLASRMLAQQEEQKKIANLVKKRNQLLSARPEWLQKQEEMKNKMEEIRKIHEGEALVIENDISRDDREKQVTLTVPVNTPELVVFDPQFNDRGKLPDKIKLIACGRNQGANSNQGAGSRQSGKCGRRSPVRTRGRADMNNEYPDDVLFAWPYPCNLCRKAGYYRRTELEGHYRAEHFEELFHCKYCDWFGCNREELKTHDLVHHKMPQQSPDDKEKKKWLKGFEEKNQKRLVSIDSKTLRKKLLSAEWVGLSSQGNENVIRSWYSLPPMMDLSHTVPRPQER